MIDVVVDDSSFVGAVAVDAAAAADDLLVLGSPSLRVDLQKNRRK